LIVCHDYSRRTIDGASHLPVPSLESVIDLNLSCARLTNPGVRVAGISLNTRGASDSEASMACDELEARLGLPCVDPMRHGAARLVDKLLAVTPQPSDQTTKEIMGAAK
jgi:uncharacterized NAD-dependent epimerase/dehydratase family protein